LDNLTVFLRLLANGKCSETADATQTKVRQLHQLMVDLLNEQRDLAKRIRCMETSFTDTSAVQRPAVSTIYDDTLSMRSISRTLRSISPCTRPLGPMALEQLHDSQEDGAIRPESPSSTDNDFSNFQKDLWLSRAYRRFHFRNSIISTNTRADESIAVSMFSQITLADIPNVFSVPLPVTGRELYNDDWYMSMERLGQRRPSTPSTTLKERFVRKLSNASTLIGSAWSQRSSSISSTSSESSEMEESKTNREIDRRLKEERLCKSKDIPILVVGGYLQEKKRFF
jgi:hypothetical protein